MLHRFAIVLSLQLGSLFAACENHAALYDSRHVDIGVRLATVEAPQYRDALGFWTTVLDIAWHPDDSDQCAVEVVDRPAVMFKTIEVAYAFRESGVIAVNASAHLKPGDSYATAVHEVGHLLGLRHNRSPKSVMFYIDVREDAILDRHDTEILAKLHTLRTKAKEIPIRLSGSNRMMALLKTD